MSEPLSLCLTLWTMSFRAWRSRTRRGLERLFSPKRLFASLAAFGFLGLYVFNGVMVVMTRRAADPDALMTWMSGGMAVYAIFHFVRAAWQEPESRLGLSPAQTQWIMRAPIGDGALVTYRMATMIPATLVKTCLVATVLACDASSAWRLVAGLFLSMFVLEAIRIMADSITASLSPYGQVAMRTVWTAIAISLAVQLIARMISHASGSVHPLAMVNAFSMAAGETASCDAIRVLAMPWWMMTQFAITPSGPAIAFGQFAAAGSIAMLAVACVAWVDRWSSRHDQWVQSDRLVAIRRGTIQAQRSLGITNESRKSLWSLPLVCRSAWMQGVGAMMARQWVSVCRYRGSILVSLAVPAVLSLSPIVADRNAGLLHVAAWLAVSTLLLAPPALKIDFRRDIDRIGLLKSLPMTPLAMTIGQILLPTLLTIAFQILVVGIACVICEVPLTTVVLCTGVLSGLAVFSFALENALFLTFPHRPKQEGIAMMVRAKLMFLGKGLLLAILAGSFLFWLTVCGHFQWGTIVLVGMGIVAMWVVAACTVLATARIWHRFDSRLDTPIAA